MATEKTAAGLVAWCKENLDCPYWYCSQGQEPTAKWLQEKIDQSRGMWTAARIEKAKTEIGQYPRCFDCVGLIKGYLWLQPSGTIKPSAKQDVTADGMRAVSSPQSITTLPEIPGTLVFLSGLVGVYIGDGRVIEAYNFKNVADRPLSAQKWTHWGKCPWITYAETGTGNNGYIHPKAGDYVRFKDGFTTYYPGGPGLPASVKTGDPHVVTKVPPESKPVIYGGAKCVLLGKRVNLTTGKEDAGVNTWTAVDFLERVPAAAAAQATEEKNAA